MVRWLKKILPEGAIPLVEPDAIIFGIFSDEYIWPAIAVEIPDS
jgi:hypothetical protein